MTSQTNDAIVTLIEGSALHLLGTINKSEQQNKDKRHREVLPGVVFIMLILRANINIKPNNTEHICKLQ